MKKLLLVEDNESILKGLTYSLEQEKFEVDVSKNVHNAKKNLDSNEYDLIILDIMLPDGNGFELCKYIKEQKDTPIIILTAKDEEQDVVQGFNLGADDYVIKPFSPKELEARVKAVLRRTNNRETSTPTGKVAKNVITTGNIKIDTARRQVFRKNERIRLTGMEFSLLELLVNNSGQAFSRNEILQHVWAYPPDHRIDTRVVDVHISRLRSKLESDPANPELILTARGIGYMFQRIS